MTRQGRVTNGTAERVRVGRRDKLRFGFWRFRADDVRRREFTGRLPSSLFRFLSLSYFLLLGFGEGEGARLEGGQGRGGVVAISLVLEGKQDSQESNDSNF